MLPKDVWIDGSPFHRNHTLFRLMAPEGRTLPCRLVSEARSAGRPVVAQGEVWDSVARCRCMGIRSDTCSGGYVPAM